MGTDYVIRGASVVDAACDPKLMDLLIKDGKIAGRLAPGTSVDASFEVLNAARTVS
jgi:N-acyl-D-aspartate/D-glutamate deacylase